MGKSFSSTRRHNRRHSPPPQPAVTTMSQSGEHQVSSTGTYDRKPSTFRDTVVAGSRFTPEAGRYHLHVSLACPWACGTLSMLHLKGLENVISHSVVHPTWQRTRPDKEGDEHCGWVYKSPGDPPLRSSTGHGSFACDDALKPDTVTGCATIRDLYDMAGAGPGTTYSTPVLWDTKLKTIVNNESTEILRMFNSSFGELATKSEVDLYPAELEEELSALNENTVYPINNGVYRCGFARTQVAYEEAMGALYLALDEIEERLASRRFLTGDKLTWVDLRLFHTLARFDPVYVTYFKTNAKRIADYPNLLGFTRDVYSSNDAIARTINISHIKTHYFTSHPHLNTFAIIPQHSGPDLAILSGRAAM